MAGEEDAQRRGKSLRRRVAAHSPRRKPLRRQDSRQAKTAAGDFAERNLTPAIRSQDTRPVRHLTPAGSGRADAPTHSTYRAANFELGAALRILDMGGQLSVRAPWSDGAARPGPARPELGMTLQTANPARQAAARTPARPACVTSPLAKVRVRQKQPSERLRHAYKIKTPDWRR